MSSRSKGVMNVWFSLVMISWGRLIAFMLDCLHLLGSYTQIPRILQDTAEQLGAFSQIARKFREKLEGWLDLVRTMWPECPASIDQDGTGLFVERANAVLPARGIDAHN